MYREIYFDYEFFESMEKEHPDWQKTIFEKTGVLVKIDYYAVSFETTCAFIVFERYQKEELDEDLELDCTHPLCCQCVEYKYRYDQETYDISNVRSLDDLIESIKLMYCYQQYLQDHTLGKFSKSDLYYGIWNRILRADLNFSRIDPYTGYVYDPQFITADYDDTNGVYDVSITYEFGQRIYGAFDTYGFSEFYLHIQENTTLDDALKEVCKKLNEEKESLWANNDKVIYYELAPATDYKIPETYEELLALDHNFVC